jgi:hypothetical protein
MNAFSNSGLFSRPRASVVASYSEFQRMVRYACSLKLAASRKAISTFESDWPEKIAFEVDLLNTIHSQKAGLTLSRAEANFAIYGTGAQTRCAYRLASAKHHANFDFTLLPFRAGFEAHAIMLEVDPQWQGSFFRLRTFLIDEVAQTLFGLRGSIVYQIIGHASSKVMPSHKLVKLYERLGAVKAQNTVRPVMVILNPKAAEFVDLYNPEALKRFKAGKTFERKRVPPRPNYRPAPPSCQ